jgi:hypothetical protein
MNRRHAEGGGDNCDHQKDRKKRYPYDGNENAGLQRKHIADDSTPFGQIRGDSRKMNHRLVFVVLAAVEFGAASSRAQPALEEPPVSTNQSNPAIEAPKTKILAEAIWIAQGRLSVLNIARSAPEPSSVHSSWRFRNLRNRLVDTQAIRCDSLQLQRWLTGIETVSGCPNQSEAVVNS